LFSRQGQEDGDFFLYARAHTHTHTHRNTVFGVLFLGFKGVAYVFKHAHTHTYTNAQRRGGGKGGGGGREREIERGGANAEKGAADDVTHIHLMM